jgi:hypothetical protein
MDQAITDQDCAIRTNDLHEAEFFLRNHISFPASQDVYFQHFMEPEGLPPSSLEPATGPYAESDETNSLFHPVSLRFILVISPHLRLESS